ncbi:MAG TPA: 2-C-methyl-D-erythritol 2,4-cyclodiphosphate synthase [Balneolales bacterium]|nr:2-C-methyl-D-erythritol 2,4-cyclodiphosphate synthase [Balneolales bacterium]
MRIGYGYDVHQLVENRPLIIGGVTIPHIKGLKGHSDADVLLHAITDALLGAMALGDIGSNFPDNAKEFKNIDSRILLRDSFHMVREYGYVLGNLDATIVAQKPKLSPYIDSMRENIMNDLHTDLNKVSIKATTSERMGFVGREEGISAMAVVLLESIEI